MVRNGSRPSTVQENNDRSNQGALFPVVNFSRGTLPTKKETVKGPTLDAKARAASSASISFGRPLELRCSFRGFSRCAQPVVLRTWIRAETAVLLGGLGFGMPPVGCGSKPCAPGEHQKRIWRGTAWNALRFTLQQYGPWGLISQAIWLFGQNPVPPANIRSLTSLDVSCNTGFKSPGKTSTLQKLGFDGSSPNLASTTNSCLNM